MKKVYILILILIILFLIFFPRKNNKNSNINYIINGFNVNENIKNNKTYIKITNKEDNYYYTLDNKYKKIVKNIELYSDKVYNCIYITFNNDTNSNDLICNKDNINYLYSTGEIKSSTLDSYYETLLKQNKIKLLYNDITTYDKKDLFTFYTNNIIKTLFITTYKGLYVIDDNIEEINLFDSDVYEQDIKVFYKDKYIIANYNEQYDFNSFYIVDLKTKKVSTMKSKYNISFNSELIADNDYIYLKDKDNDKNYIIDIENKIVKLIEEVKITQYIKDYKIVKEIDNTYYLEKDNVLYKTSNTNLEDITYLFNLNNKKNIQIGKSYICFNNDIDLLCYYKNTYQTLLTNNEFKFNKTINYYIYERIR